MSTDDQSNNNLTFVRNDSSFDDSNYKLLLNGFKHFFHLCSELICITDKNGILREVNPAWKNVLGYDPDDLIGKPIIDFIHPDDTNKTQVELVHSGYERRDIFFENRYISKQGKTVWLRWQSIPDEKTGLIYGMAEDITELKSKNNSLRIFTGLIDDSPSSIGMVFLPERKIYLNNTFKSNLGYDEKELELHGGPSHVYIDKKQAETVFTTIEKGDFWEGEVKLLSKKGKELTFYLSAGPIYTSDKKIIAIYGIHIDINETVSTRSRLKEVNKRLNNILNSTPDAYILVDSQWKIIHHNAQASHILTGKSEIFGDTSFWDLDLNQHLIDLKDDLSRAAVHKCDSQFEFFDEAQQKWFEIRTFPVDNDLSIFFRDITKDKEYNQQLIALNDRRTLVEKATNEAIWEWDLLTDTIIWSEGFFTFFGYDTTTEPIHGEEWKDIVHPDDRERVFNSINAIINNSKKERWEQEYRIRKADGTYCHVLDRAYILTDSNNQPLKMIGALLDISSVKEAEARTRMSEKRFRALVNSSSDIIAVMDFKGIITFLSFSIKSVLKIKPKKLVGTAILERIHPDDKLDIVKTIKKLRYKSQVNFKPYRFLDGKNRWRWLESTATIRRNDPIINGIVTNTRDVTERIEMEKKRDEAINKYDIVSKATSDTIWDWDLVSNTIQWNKNTDTHFGYNEQDISPGIEWRFSRIHPDDKERFINSISALVSESKERWQGEYRFKDADGNWRYIYDRGFVLFNNKGKAIRMIGSMQDITELKKEQQQLKLLESVITNTNEGITITDGNLLDPPEHKIIYVNNAVMAMSGYTREEILGQTHRMFQGKQTSKETRAKIREALKNEQHIETDIINYKKNGDPFWSHISIYPVFDDKKRLTHFFGLKKDITIQKQNEIERENLIKELRLSNNDLRQFSYITSHNLRGPISNLMGLVSLLEYVTIEDEELAQLIHGFKVSSEQLNTTIEDLISILITKDQSPVKVDDINIDETTKLCLSNIETTYKSIDYTLETDFSECKTIYFNRSYLDNILMNLLTNAIKFHSLDRKLTITIISAINENNEPVVYFTDNGLGIDLKRYGGRIFGLYQRFHNQNSGKGLGLYLIKTQLEAFRASIDVQSTVNEGTQFTLTFKRHD